MSMNVTKQLLDGVSGSLFYVNLIDCRQRVMEHYNHKYRKQPTVGEDLFLAHNTLKSLEYTFYSDSLGNNANIWICHSKTENLAISK